MADGRVDRLFVPALVVGFVIIVVLARYAV